RSRKMSAPKRELNRARAHLISRSARIALWGLLTGQVHSTPSGGEWLVEPVATRTMKHWSDLILRLRQTPKTDVRDGILEKKNGVEVSGAHSLFRIGEDGIEDV